MESIESIAAYDCQKFRCRDFDWTDFELLEREPTAKAARFAVALACLLTRDQWKLCLI